MRSPRRGAPLRARESGSIIILLLVVLAAVGGGWWYMKSNRDRREQEGREFANEAARRIVLQQDAHFLDFSLTQKAQMQYPPSWRFRLLNLVREPGTPDPQFQMKGDMQFTNQFFEPHGQFLAQFNYPTGPAFLELHISHPGALWVIDDLNWTWQPPAPTPVPLPPPAAPLPPASPSPR